MALLGLWCVAVVCGLWSVVCSLSSVVCRLSSVVRGLESVVCDPWSVPAAAYVVRDLTLNGGMDLWPPPWSDTLPVQPVHL